MRTPSQPTPRSGPDLVLFTIVVSLMGLGLVSVYSASYPRAAHDTAVEQGRPLPPEPTLDEEGQVQPPRGRSVEQLVSSQQVVFIRQARWCGFALVTLLLALYLPYPLLRHRLFVCCCMVLALVLLVAVLKFGTGAGHGAKRWLVLPNGFVLQPSEFAKFALVMYLAQRATYLRERIREPVNFVGLMLVVAVMAFLLLKEPHLGATMVLAGATIAVMLGAGARQKHLGLLVLGVFLVALTSLALRPYQRVRIQVWFHPERYEDNGGYQGIHCMTAMARGGAVGRGLGRSIEKFYYLPECYTDSIAAIVGEELGCLGLIGILALFVGFAVRGLSIADRCTDTFGSLLAIGITAAIFLQALVNLGVTSGLLPQTGVGLPFFSYGGSSLCCFTGATGLLMNISRQRPSRSRFAVARERTLARRKAPTYGG